MRARKRPGARPSACCGSPSIRRTICARPTAPGACEAMLEKVERALANGLRPAEEMGPLGRRRVSGHLARAHAEMLAAHAQVLAGLAARRTSAGGATGCRSP
jgi:hypothetical protein